MGMQRDPRRRQSKFASILRRDGNTCWFCGEPIDLTLPREHEESWTFEHVIPTAHGGGNDNDNLRLTHWACNQARRDNPLAAASTSNGGCDA